MKREGDMGRRAGREKRREKWGKEGGRGKGREKALLVVCFLSEKRVIIQVQSFIIKCLSFRRVSFVQGYRLRKEKLCT